jgi:branched-subunit amino acid transport protein
MTGTAMSWSLVIALSLGAYAFKALGFVVLGARTLPEPLTRCLALIPAALLTALILKDTFSVGQEWAFDAPVVVLAAFATAVVRAL